MNESGKRPVPDRTVSLRHAEYGDAFEGEIWTKVDGTRMVSAYWGEWLIYANVPASEVVVLRPPQ